MPRRLLIVAHAPSPNTERLREAALAGARHPEIEGVETLALGPFEATPEHVLAADALLLGTSENLGYMSGALKDFFDRIYYPCLEETEGRAFGFYIRAGHDGTGARRAIESVTTGLRWRPVAAPVICRGEWRDDFPQACHELGMTLAAGLEAGVF